MTAGIETSIWLSLQSRVTSLLPSYPKAWPGEVFAVPSSGGKPAPFLRIGRVSVAPVRLFMGDDEEHKRTGRLIITLVYPLGQDVAVYDQIAAGIARHFAEGTEMTFSGLTVVVSDTPHVQEGYEDNGYWNMPVSIPWRCYA